MKAAPPDIAAVTAHAERVFGLRARPDSVDRAGVGRRARSLVSRRSGKYSRHRLARRGSRDLAVDATLRAAAARTGLAGERPVGVGLAGERPVGVGLAGEQARAGSGSKVSARIAVRAEDLRWKVRRHRVPLAVVLVVDNSYSVRAERMIEAAKGLALALVRDATRHGDRVAVVAFQGGTPKTTVAVPLTRAATLAHRRLRRVPLAGQTPLAHALRQGARVLRQDGLKRALAVPLLVVITDGLPTVPLRPGGDPVADVLAQAVALRRAGIHCVVADTLPPDAAPSQAAASCCQALAAASGGTLLRFDELLVPGGPAS